MRRLDKVALGTPKVGIWYGSQSERRDCRGYVRARLDIMVSNEGGKKLSTFKLQGLTG